MEEEKNPGAEGIGGQNKIVSKKKLTLYLKGRKKNNTTRENLVLNRVKLPQKRNRE